jgi:PPK2 family polyphosphate:nucleotide phosphotransferase
MTDVLHGLRVEPGHPARLHQRDPASRCGLRDRDEAEMVMAEELEQLRELQGRLWGESARSILLVLQGMDTAGKDGTIRKVFSGVNPQACRVAAFKAPNPMELAYDFLWRVHREVPREGEIGIFNRSHYEDVVAARIVGAIDDKQCERRMHHIRSFEALLHDEGTTVCKVFLHISRDEQRERLQARLDEPTKRWKFDPGDLETRRRWDEYQARYETALTETSTEHAPWHVVPADRKWVRDVVVARLLVATLERLDPQYPPPPPGLDDVQLV